MSTAFVRRAAWASAVMTALMACAARGEPPARGALSFVEFVSDDDADCVMREGRMILVRSRHESRTIRVWLERYHLGKPTGDRSHSDLLPHAEAQKLGCSRTDFGAQEWRPVKAQFVDP